MPILVEKVQSIKLYPGTHTVIFMGLSTKQRLILAERVQSVEHNLYVFLPQSRGGPLHLPRCTTEGKTLMTGVCSLRKKSSAGPPPTHSPTANSPGTEHNHFEETLELTTGICYDIDTAKM